LARDNAQEATRGPTAHASSPPPNATPTPSPSPHDILGLYDDALSCALDDATLAEIVEEFVPRLVALDRDAAAQGERIYARHRDRVAALSISTRAIDNDPDAGGPS
jgi:hypothetical protein